MTKDLINRPFIRRWIYRLRLYWHTWHKYRAIRSQLRMHRYIFRIHRTVPLNDVLISLLPVAVQHNIEFGELELNFPETNPLFLAISGGEPSRRRIFYSNIIAVKNYKGFIWLVVRQGAVIGFSVTSSRRISDYFFLEPSGRYRRVPKWWAYI